jgi:hypothetical protein
MWVIRRFFQNIAYRKRRSALTILRGDSDHMTATYGGVDGYVGNTLLIRPAIRPDGDAVTMKD